MRHLILLLLGLSFAISLSPTAVAATTFAPTQTGPERLSIRSNGEEANQDSITPDVSADGRYIAFTSAASNLVDNDHNQTNDIFVRDRQTGQTSRVSLHSHGHEANGPSFSPSISADGRYVAFYSLASNLVDGDNNNYTDIFVHDRQTGQTSLVSVVLGGTANSNSRNPAISANGRYITFVSSASNLVGGDTNGKDDIFRWDREALIMQIVSVDSNEAAANDHSHTPSISGDGNHIAFVSDASNLVPGDGNNSSDIFLRNMADGSTNRISLSYQGQEANGQSWEPAISDNGQFVAFVSLANNLVTVDGNGYADLFVRDLANNHTELVSLATDNTQGNDWSEMPSISANGRYVTFHSSATNLVPGANNNLKKLFLRDRQQNSLTLISVNSQGHMANDNSYEPLVAANGRYVVYSSHASNLVTNDHNGRRDVFIYDFIGPPTLSINHTIGAPGSYFVLTGLHWASNSSADLYINSHLVGSIPIDSNGNLSAQLITTATTEQGSYLVRVHQGEHQRQLLFMVRAGAPLHYGSGDGFTLPDNIALSELIYLPTIRR